jgi:hypothetical protein
MTRDTIRGWTRPFEKAGAEERWVMLCFLAGRDVALDEAEANGALRRAALLLAASGDPHRELELYGRAVTAVARDIDTPERRRQLADGLAALEDETSGVPGAAEGLRLLRGDPDLAWQAFAAALLAEELGSDDA